MVSWVKPTISGLEPIGTFDARDLSTTIEKGHLDLAFRRVEGYCHVFFQWDDPIWLYIYIHMISKG